MAASTSTRLTQAEQWEALIPHMQFMALLRNLRNFEEAGISKDVRKQVTDKLTNSAEVAKSRQFPIRFFSAYKNTGSEHWTAALEEALGLSLVNVPELQGRTLILVDCSGSMDSALSERSKITLREAAAVFGVALAKRCEKVDIYAYGSSHITINVNKSTAVLRAMSQFKGLGGTETWQTVQKTYKGHDRVVILTDEQAFDVTQRSWRTSAADPSAMIAKGVNTIWMFNLAGYKQGMTASGDKGRYTIGGLSDACFKIMDIVENRREDAVWPF